MGPLTFGRKEEQIFLGRDIAHHQDYSEDTAVKIDQEVKRIVERNYQRAKELLTENRDLLERVAETLLEREVLDAEEVKMVMQGIPLKDKSAEVPQDDKAAKPETESGERKPALRPPLPALNTPKSVPQS